MRTCRIAYALGGGGARGTAHLGVIKCLADAGIAPDFIVGTSAGALAGAACALYGSPDEATERVMAALHQLSLVELEQQFVELSAPSGDGWKGQLRQTVTQARKLMLWNRQAVRPSIIGSEALHELARNVVGDAEFGDTVVPFYAVAHDLVSNRDVIMGAGDLDVAVWASGAIPGIFSPVRVDDLALVDGCALQVLPTRAAVSLGADLVIAVDISLDVPTGAPDSAAEILHRVSEVRADLLRRQAWKLAAVVINPDVHGIRWMEVSKGEYCYNAGQQAAQAALPAVHRALRRAWWKSLLRRLVPPQAATEEIVQVRRADLKL